MMQPLRLLSIITAASISANRRYMVFPHGSNDGAARQRIGLHTFNAAPLKNPSVQK
jgi:hypothetical protein